MMDEEDKSVSLKKVADVLWQCTSHTPSPPAVPPAIGEGREKKSFPLTFSYVQGASWGRCRGALWKLRSTVKWCLIFDKVLAETFCSNDENVGFGKCLQYR